MAKNSFKAKNSLNLEPQTRATVSDTGDMYFDHIKKSFASKSDYWSFLESKVDVPFQANFTSSNITSLITENAIIKIIGTPSASFNMHGLARNNNAKLIHLYNDTTQKLLIKNQSTTETVPGNRIFTPKGTDLSVPKKTLVILFYDDTIGGYMAVQAGGGGGGTSFDQVQVAHGFTMFTPIYHDGTNWQKAQANASNTLAIYIVTEFSTDAFTATKFGQIEAPGHGFTVGQFYYTSRDTAGAITATEPIFGYSNPVLYVQDATLVHCLVHRPTLIGDGTVSDSEIGAIMAFPSFVEPIGFLYADGRPVSRATYNELFSSVGTRYGSGDGSTTFNLPDLRGQFLRGGVEVLDQNFNPGDVNTTSETITLANHKFRHSGFKVRFSSTGTLPSPLSIATDYYIIWVDDNNFKVATSLANATAGLAINISTTGSGVHTVSQYADPDASSRFATQFGGATGNSFGAYQDDQFASHSHQQKYTQTTLTGSTAYPPQADFGTVQDGAFTTVAGGSETRSKNVTVGWFIRHAAKGAVKGTDVPTGVMLSFGGSSASIPNGYLLCDGSSLNRADYPLLFAAIGTAWGTASSTTFNLPDTRGLFLRGVDGLAGRDADTLTRTALATGGNTGNAVGSYQADVFASHTHTPSTAAGTVNLHDPGAAGTFVSSTNSTPVTGTAAINQGATTISSTGGTETRPKNVYVNHIIKY